MDQKTTFGLLPRDAICEERGALQQAVIDGHEDNLPEWHHVRLDRVVAMVLLGFEEQLEVGDERRGKLAQGDVADLITLFDKLRMAKKAKSIVTLSFPKGLKRWYAMFAFTCPKTASGSTHRLPLCLKPSAYDIS